MLDMELQHGPSMVGVSVPCKGYRHFVCAGLSKEAVYQRPSTQSLTVSYPFSMIWSI